MFNEGTSFLERQKNDHQREASVKAWTDRPVAPGLGTTNVRTSRCVARCFAARAWPRCAMVSADSAAGRFERRMELDGFVSWKIPKMDDDWGYISILGSLKW